MCILTHSDMHPYECDHDKFCIHCTNGKTEYHHPEKCWLCCDGDPRKNKPWRLCKDNYAIRIWVKDYSHKWQKVKVKTVTQLKLGAI